MTAEEQKRERLIQEAHDEAEHARAARQMREWVCVVASNVATFTREEQRQTLKALGAHMTVWRDDYVHPDGWPQPYKITLHWTGSPVVVPARVPNREPT